MNYEDPARVPRHLGVRFMRKLMDYPCASNSLWLQSKIPYLLA